MSENRTLEQSAPAFHALLSAFGRDAAFPPDIPFQAAEARGKSFNATIGQITDGAGSPVSLVSVDRQLAGMAEDRRSQALLYSPIQGIETLRQSWRSWQRREVAIEVPSSLPLVTVGLTHGLSLVADLFGGAERPVAVPVPFWGNYRQTFALRTGARIVTSEAYREMKWHPEALAEALSELPAGQPALAILNLPSNPGGYSPSRSERDRLVTSLLAVADQRPLGVICDDAYAGLTFEDDVPADSLFWQLAGSHPQLAAMKVDGATKEFGLFGSRVGFLTFGVPSDSPAAAVLESKTKCLLRATVGSPVATGQALLLGALESGEIDREIEQLRAVLAERYRVLRAAVTRLDSTQIQPLPFNSGCFALLKLTNPDGPSAEAVRRHLLDEHDTGLIAIGTDYLRIAFCSVRAEALDEVVDRIARGVRELS